MKSSKKAILITLLVLVILLIDQSLKIWVKTNMFYGEGISLFGHSWAQLHFVENPGMAFGYNLGGDLGKIALSLFRIFAVAFLIYFINRLIKSKASFALLSCFALILAGAIGNILDSAFYGFLFDKGTIWDSSVEAWVHYTGKSIIDFEGYSGFLKGCVVDMLYFPMFDGTFPAWVPFWGGEPFLFFKPVFNIADASITIGVLSIILFHRNFFSKELESEETINTALKQNITTDSTKLNETTDPESTTATTNEMLSEKSIKVQQDSDEDITSKL